MKMTRKEFLGSVIGAAGVAMLAACGGDDSSAGADAASQRSCTMNGTAVNIVGNHGHVLMVSKADIAAAADKTYDITGTSPHAHSVTVTAANFATLASNQSVSLNSTSGGSPAHTHSILVMCA